MKVLRHCLQLVSNIADVPSILIIACEALLVVSNIIQAKKNSLKLRAIR